MRHSGALAIACLVIAIAACGSTGPGVAAHRTAAKTVPAGAARLCGWPDASSHLITMRTPDDVRLAGYEAGTGPRGVLLVPEADGLGSCGWWPYAAYLEARGFRVLAFDHRCQANSACPARTSPDAALTDIATAARRLGADGASRLALAGGSQGGAETILAAARLSLGITGVAVLSADVLDTPLAPAPGPRTGVAAALSVKVPAFAAVAADDPAVSVDDTRRLFGSMPGHSQLVVVPLGGHGYELVNPVDGGQTPALAATLAGFLARILR